MICIAAGDNASSDSYLVSAGIQDLHFAATKRVFWAINATLLGSLQRSRAPWLVGGSSLSPFQESLLLLVFCLGLRSFLPKECSQCIP